MPEVFNRNLKTVKIERKWTRSDESNTICADVLQMLMEVLVRRYGTRTEAETM